MTDITSSLNINLAMILPEIIPRGGGIAHFACLFHRKGNAGVLCRNAWFGGGDGCLVDPVEFPVRDFPEWLRSTNSA